MGRRFTAGGTVGGNSIHADGGPAARFAPKIYHLDPGRAGPSGDWSRHVEHAARLNFDHLCIGPIFAVDGSDDPLLVSDLRRTAPGLACGSPPEAAIARIAKLSADQGLRLFVDIVLDRFAADGETARELAGLYQPPIGLNSLDPQIDRAAARTVIVRPDAGARLVPWWAERLAALASAGATGFRLLGLSRLPVGMTRQLIAATREQVDCAFWAWTPGLEWSRHPDLAEAGLEAVFGSTAWWDGRAGWYVEEYEALRRLAPVIGVVEAPLQRDLVFQPGPSKDLVVRRRRTLKLAAATTHGLLMPAGFENAQSEGIDLTGDVAAANALVDKLAADGIDGEMRAMSSPGAPLSVLLRVDSRDVRAARRGIVVAVNAEVAHARPISVNLDPLPPAAGVSLGDPRAEGAGGLPEILQPQEVAVVRVDRLSGAREPRRQDKRSASAAAGQSPIVIDRVTPSLDGGSFAAKHIVGRPLAIEADIFAEGHDLLAAEVLWRAVDEKEWQRAPLTPLANDRWRATITPRRVGRHYFAIEAWRDEYATLCHALEVKHDAGVEIDVELAEAGACLRRLAAGGGDLEDVVAELRDAPPAAAVALLTSSKTRRLVAAARERPFLAQEEPRAVEVERPQAEFAGWYELFPRSLTDDPSRPGTFDDVVAALPRIRAMGFDVLYLPPIHPIGTTNRKGRNNSLTAGPDDPGSPYAIGGEEGGHDALHPLLGTTEDFRRLVDAARDHGLEIALDFAVQCSLDHPWLSEHPEWFRRRPDGSIRYAENPPKKYEDIVNVDFYAEGATPDLWLALRDVVLHWVDEGVRIFRVDNPHTKPLPFWQWMIAEVRGRHPDVIFLSEAFTRPKMMYRLAKVGFSQSYTYFTWRNSKQELVDYLRELTTTEVADFFRPHFFVNTPDINPYFLQSSGRAGFLIRAALASTLSGLWGVYSGFELCEAAALPGREEYLNSEKYEIRPRDFAAPGNIVAEITALNRLRKAHPALQSHLGLTFYNAFNDQVLVYGKAASPHDDKILVAVSLDPRQPQEAAFEVPLWEWNLPDDGAVDVEDLMRGERFVWQGKLQHLRLDPATLPFAIWRISPRGMP